MLNAKPLFSDKIKSLFLKLKKQSKTKMIVFLLIFLIFGLFAFSYLYVLFWAFTSGLKTHNELVLRPFSLPDKMRFSNYGEVFSLLNVQNHNFVRLLTNSLVFSIIGPLMSQMFTAMLAYATTKFKFPGAKVYYPLTLLIMTVPIYGSTGALYKLYFRLGLISSYKQILLSWGGLSAGFLYYCACFKGLSWTYAEAAYIDGAGDYSVYFKIMFPQILNLFGALYILEWIATWNNFSSALVYLPKLPTLASGIYLFEKEMDHHVRMDVLYAAYFIASLPPLILFGIFNKALTSNISLGGVKE